MEEKKNSYLARLLAVLGLLAAAIVIVVAISSTTGTEEPANGGEQAQGRQAPTQRPVTRQRRYQVQEGDNLTIISQKTGIPVQRLERLNPDLDPQALQPGQNLKLR